MVVLIVSGSASAQSYPNRLIRVLTSEGGGGSDLGARIIAQGLTVSLGEPVIVENRGGGVVAGEIVSKAQPDGHTLLFYGRVLVSDMDIRDPEFLSQTVAPVHVSVTHYGEMHLRALGGKGVSHYFIDGYVTHELRLWA
jgi:tripartite-type tricarboxylate transporter receptor subunit TctC